MSKNSRRRHGITVIWVVVTLLVLIAFVGLATDTAWVNLVGHQLQNTADASALAGALQVRTNTTNAINQAKAAALANKAASIAIQLASNPSNDPGGDIVIGSYSLSNSTFTPTLTNPNAVQVLARLTSSSPNGALKLNFGPLAGISTSNVTRVATAMIGGTIKAGLILLDPNGNKSLSLTGTGSTGTKITVNGGGIIVDSSSSTAVSWTGSPIISADSLYINGNDTAVTSGGVFPTGHLGLNAPYVPDPIAAAGITPPTTKGTTQSGNPPFQPGYYPNGITLNGNSTQTMAPGIYYIDGNKGITLKGGAVLNGSAGVMIYLHTGGITMTGGSSMTVSPMTSGPYAGISIYQDPTNNSAVSLNGTAGQTSSGLLYFPASQVTISGTPNAFGTQLIAYDLSVQGNTSLNLNYNGAFQAQGHEVFLVR